MPTKKGSASPRTHESPRRKVARTVPSQSSTARPPERMTAAEALLRLVQATPLVEDEENLRPSLEQAAGLTASPQQSTKRGGRSTQKSVKVDGLLQHLAMLVHGMILVTWTEKAQQGMAGQVTVVGGGGGPDNDNDDGDLAEAEHVANVVVPSARVDTRWLDAVTRYCHTRVTLDDVAKVALAYPEWIRVKWGVKASSRQADQLFAAALGDGFSSAPAHSPSQSSPRPRGAPGSKERASDSTPHSEHSAMSIALAAQEALTARVYLLVSRVPSVEDAVQMAVAAESSHDTQLAPTAPRWRGVVAQHSAYQALVQQERDQGGGISSEIGRLQPDGGGGGSMSTAEVRPVSEAEHHVVGEGENADAFTVEEEALLSTLSKDLRESLSTTKLRGVLAQMQKEASQEETQAFARIEQEQEEERLLGTYAHIRSLFGPSKSQICAARLVESLEKESRFDDRRGRQKQLSLVLQLEGSGLSAVTYRSTEAGGTVTVKPQPVANLDSCTREELERVLVCLDREKGSAQAVLQSLKGQR